MTNYSALVDEQAKVMGVSSVPVVEEAGGNASTDGKSIFVDPQFFSRIEMSAGEGGVRFILAHELGHVHNGMCGGHDGELFCDEFGARSIAAMGFDATVIHNVMGELNAEATESHPGSSTRAQHALKAHSVAQAAREVDVPEPKKRVTRFPRTR